MKDYDDLSWMDDLSLRVRSPRRRYIGTAGWFLIVSALSIGAALGALHRAGAL